MSQFNSILQNPWVNSTQFYKTHDSIQLDSIKDKKWVCAMNVWGWISKVADKLKIKHSVITMLGTNEMLPMLFIKESIHWILVSK